MSYPACRGLIRIQHLNFLLVLTAVMGTIDDLLWPEPYLTTGRVVNSFVLDEKLTAAPPPRLANFWTRQAPRTAQSAGE